MKETMTWRKVIAASIVVLMALSTLAIVSFVAQAQGAIWLNAEPGAKSKGGGWPAGGYTTWGDFGPNAVCEFVLTVENRGSKDMTDLRLAMAIHSEGDAIPISDDFYSIKIESSTHYEADFGATEYNPFDEGFGGKHNVYTGTDAIWDVYIHPYIVEAGTIAYLQVTVTLGPDPTDDFEIHFNAFDTILGYKTPNGHDLTFISKARVDNEEGEPPVAVIDGGDERTVYEGDLVIFDGSGSWDPDGDIVSYEWDFDAEVDSDGDGYYANDVDATGPIVEFTWYDDYEVDVALTVTDDDGLTDTAYQRVYVLNLDPSLEFEGAFIEFDLSIRVAGEKWHNVMLEVVEDYGTQDEMSIGALEVERWPGSPDDNPSDGDVIPISFRVDEEAPSYTAIVTYDPYKDEGDAIMGDQEINGQLWGANPVWLIAEFGDGTVCKQHHTFNVQQSMPEGRDSNHWNHVEPWIVPITLGASAGMPIKFVASASDPGTDDLIFEWDWGDATVDTIVHLYDGLRGPDPAFPPGSPYEPLGAPWDVTSSGGTVPALATDMTYHTFSAAGTFTVTLTVYDDDGGEAAEPIEIILEVGDGFCH